MCTEGDDCGCLTSVLDHCSRMWNKEGDGGNDLIVDRVTIVDIVDGGCIDPDCLDFEYYDGFRVGDVVCDFSDYLLVLMKF